jgi:hypothetical protein
MEALGRLNDVVVGAVPVDLTTAGSTGKRVSLRNAGGVQIVQTLAAAASGTETVTFTLQQHTAGSGGTSANLAVVDHFYIKVQAAGSETWQRVNQAASATISIADTTGTITGAAQKNLVVAIEVDAQALSDGYTHVSLNVADPGTVSRLGSTVYNLRDLHVMRAPANLPNPQA